MGLSIGLIFLAVFLRKKSEGTGVEFCYLPNCRVLKSLRSKPLETGADLSTAPDTLAIAYLLQEGDVRFKESTPRAEPCGIYVVQGKYREQSPGGKALSPWESGQVTRGEALSPKYAA